MWNGGNAAGSMLKCADNTEIVVHDNLKRLASLLYYEGDNTNKITIGRDMGWGALSSVVISGNVTTTGTLTNGATSYLFAGYLRTNGSDYGNTIYQDLAAISGQLANIGFTLRNANSFNFYSFSTLSGVDLQQF